jgi:hypothetical protein
MIPVHRITIAMIVEWIYMYIVTHRSTVRQRLSNTCRGNEYARREDILCYAMDVFSVWSDPRLYNEKQRIIDSSVDGLLWSVESAQ